MIGCGSRNRWSYGLSGASRARFGNSVCLQLFIAAFPAKLIKSTSCGDWRLRGIAYADPPAWKQVVTWCRGHRARSSRWPQMRAAHPRTCRWDRRTESLGQHWERVLAGPPVLPAACLLQSSIPPAPCLEMSVECEGSGFISSFTPTKRESSGGAAARLESRSRRVESCIMNARCREEKLLNSRIATERPL